MKAEPGTILDGRYLLESLLGSGGMAEVYLARHLTLGSHHAAKIIESRSSAVRKRLLAEGQVQAALRHPNVVTVTDAIEFDGAPVLIMEFVRGPPLSWLAQEMSFSEAQIDDLVGQLMAGVAAAHELGIVHRDLKPANLLIDVSRARPVLKIADFGLMKVLQTDQPAQTQSGSTFGTPEYMAPEQIRDASRVDARADIFSLGALIYELATSRRCFPYTDQDLFALFSRITNGKYTPPDEFIPAPPPRVCAAIRSALETDRDLRCQTIAQLGQIFFDGAAPSLANPWAGPKFKAIIERWNESTRSSVPPPVVPSGPRIPDRRAAPWVGPVSASPPAPPDPRMSAAHPDDVGLPARPTQQPQIAYEDSPAASNTLAPWAQEPGDDLPARKSADRRWLAVAGALSIVGLVGLVGLLLLASWPAPSVPLPAPVALAPKPVASPDPVQAPAPVPVAAPSAPRPVQPPRPQPIVAPEPNPEPEPTAVASLTPLPEPPPRPPPILPPRFDVTGASDITLALINESGQPIPLQQASPGRYRFVAFFEPRVPTDIATVDVNAGSSWTVRCSVAARACNIKQN